MRKYFCTCQYCDHKWNENVYYVTDLENLVCSVCKDKNIKVQKHESVDYYSDNPDIKEKIK